MFEQLNDTTFERAMPSGDKVEIGDLDSKDFKPHLKLNRWDGECFIKVGLPTKTKKSPIIAGDKVKWVDRDIEANFYPLEPRTVIAKDKDGKDVSFTQNDLGGFEFEVILKKKPKTNKIVLDIETQGLRFCYQPESTPKEIAEGCIRPDNVVGSYAVYHATRTNMHTSKADADKYKCGKAFHWFRPLIWDSSNPRTEVWGELNVDPAKGLRTVTIPQDFLDSAVYPVTIDDTFGYTTPGGSWITIDNYIRGSTYTGAAGTLDNVKAYIRSQAGSHIFKLGVYKDSDGVLIYGSGNIDSGWTEGTWITATAGSEALSAIDYNLVAWAGDWPEEVAYDTDTEERVWYAKTFNSWPTPISFGSAPGWRFSIYCTYTPGIAPPAAVMPWNLAPKMAMMISSH